MLQCQQQLDLLLTNISNQEDSQYFSQISSQTMNPHYMDHNLYLFMDFDNLKDKAKDMVKDKVEEVVEKATDAADKAKEKIS